MKRLLLILCIGTSLCACTRWDSQSFIEDTDVRLEEDGKCVFIYEPLTCQLSFNSGNGTFRAMTDNASDYFTAIFKSMPEAVGDMVSADLAWTTDNDIVEKKDVALEVMRLEGDKVWLWNQSGRIALVVRLLI